MEPWEVIEVKKAVLGIYRNGETKPGLLDEALEQLAKVNTKVYRRMRMVYEFEFDERGEMKTAVEVRYRRPWK